MRYRIIGAIDSLIGTLLSLQALTFLVFVLPRLNFLYKETGTEQPITSYIVSAVMVVLGFTSIFLGATQFSSNKQKYFKFALINLIIILLGIILYIIHLTTSVLFPIYSLTR